MLALGQTVLNPFYLKDPPANDFFTCQYCADQFKREDHLRRHELSHRSPKFKCLYDGCGKLFHRNDVLKRHQLVHRPEPQKRRNTGRKRVASKRDANHNSLSVPRCSENDVDSSRTSMKYLSGLQIYTTPPGPRVIKCPSPSNTSNVDIMENASLSSWSASSTYMAVLDQSPGILGSPLMLFIQRAFQSTLFRLPFVHPSLMEKLDMPRELELALAAIGARDLDSNYGPGAELFHEAEQSLQQSNNTDPLRRLQCQVLLIEFAAWSGNEALEQWAIKEQQVVAMAVKRPFLKPRHLWQSGWASWLYAEEMKRTVFAFYSLSISIAVLLGYPIPLHSSFLGLAFPSSDDIWQTNNELEWTGLFALYEAQCELTITLPTVVHSFLTGHVGFIQAKLQTLSLFSQHITLCAIIEAIESSRRFPLNYSSIEGWITGSVSSYTSQAHFLQVLKLWNDATYQPPERSWVRGLLAQPRLESVMLLKCAIGKLSDNEAPINSLEIRYVANQATECFWGISKIGFVEFMQIAPPAMSPSCHLIAIDLAQTMRRWLSRLDSAYMGQDLDPADAEIVKRVTEAVAEGIQSISHPLLTPILPAVGDLKELCARVVELWNIILGNMSWAADTFGKL